MSWEELLKRGSSKKLNLSDLIEITLSNARPLKGQTLDVDDYFEFIQTVSREYSARNHNRADITYRVKQKITSILKRRDLLEVNRVRLYPNYTGESTIDSHEYIFKE